MRPFEQDDFPLGIAPENAGEDLVETGMQFEQALRTYVEVGRLAEPEAVAAGARPYLLRAVACKASGHSRAPLTVACSFSCGGVL